MDRKEFLSLALKAGIGTAFIPSILASCIKDPKLNPKFKGKVIIIGAGAAGLMAGYILQLYGADFQILEASNDYGGRVKRHNDFADFPMDIGAEWIHTNPSILNELQSGNLTNFEEETIKYNPDLYKWDGEVLKKGKIESALYSEYKFKQTTWYGYFEKYIIPSFADKIIYNAPVKNVDYNLDKTEITTENNDKYTADKVVITSSVNVLKNGSINFAPNLPDDKKEALNNITMPAGLKVYFKMQQKFYKDYTDFNKANGDKGFLDIAFKKNSNDSVVALFCVGDAADQYVKLDSNDDIAQKTLQELDKIYNNEGSKNYINHFVQNWSAEQYIQGSYSHEISNYRRTVKTMKTPVKNKLFFAGEAYAIVNQATVHGAGKTGIEVAYEILNF
jgi:monoamine oxidase